LRWSDVREAVLKGHPGSSPPSTRSLETAHPRATSLQRTTSALLGILGVFAVAMASVGVYGLASFVLSRRKREIAIRIALGAEPHEVQRMIVDSSGPLLVGAILGGVAALASGPVLGSVLYGVEPYDLVTIGAAASGLLVLALFAGYPPIRAAARTAAMERLRREG